MHHRTRLLLVLIWRDVRAISHSTHADIARPRAADLPHNEAISRFDCTDPSFVNEVTRMIRPTEIDSSRTVSHISQKSEQTETNCDMTVCAETFSGMNFHSLPRFELGE